MWLSGTPFRRTLVLAVDKMVEILFGPTEGAANNREQLDREDLVYWVESLSEVNLEKKRLHEEVGLH
jgi:hypothetical protein